MKEQKEMTEETTDRPTAETDGGDDAWRGSRDLRYSFEMEEP